MKLVVSRRLSFSWEEFRLSWPFVTLPFLPDYDGNFVISFCISPKNLVGFLIVWFFIPASQYDEGSTKFSSAFSILCIPWIWIPFLTFLTFIVSTMSDGFLLINLESQVLRTVRVFHFLFSGPD